MNKYLEKIASKTNDSGDGFWTRQGKGMASNIAAGTPAMIGSAGVGISMMNDISYEKGVGHRSTLRKMKKDHGLDVTFSPRKAGLGDDANYLFRGGPAYGHKDDLDRLSSIRVNKNYIHTAGTKNIGILAHELGHAASYKNSSKLYRNVQIASRTAHTKGLGGLAGAAMLSSDKTKDYAWTAPAIAAAPMLLEEANANRHAYNAFTKHESRGVANKFLKKVVSKNMATYALPVVGASAGLALASKWIKPHKKVNDGK